MTATVSAKAHTRRVLLTCGGGVGCGQVVDVLVDEGQLLDDVSAQPPLLQHEASMLVNGVLSVATESESAVATNEVLAQVNFGAQLLEGAAALVVVQTHLRREDT